MRSRGTTEQRPGVMFRPAVPRRTATNPGSCTLPTKPMMLEVGNSTKTLCRQPPKRCLSGPSPSLQPPRSLRIAPTRRPQPPDRVTCPVFVFGLASRILCSLAARSRVSRLAAQASSAHTRLSADQLHRRLTAPGYGDNAQSRWCSFSISAIELPQSVYPDREGYAATKICFLNNVIVTD